MFLPTTEINNPMWPCVRDVTGNIAVGRYSQPIWRLIVGQHIDVINQHACQPIPGQYFTTTRPPLGRYFTDTPPTLRSFAQFLLLSSIFSTQLRGAFIGHCPFLAFNSGSIHIFSSYIMFFPCHRFYIVWATSLLYQHVSIGGRLFFHITCW